MKGINWPLHTRNPEFTKVFKGVKEVFVFVTTHIVTNTPNALCIRNPLGSIPEPFISGKCFYSVYIGKLINRRLAYVRFYEGDIEHHHGVEGIMGKLKRRNIEVHEYYSEKRVKWKRSSSSYDRLGEGHHARRKEMQSLVRARLADHI